MKSTDVPLAIDGILYDAKLKLDNKHSPGSVFYFVEGRLLGLKKQLIREGAYRHAERTIVEEEL